MLLIVHSIGRVGADGASAETSPFLSTRHIPFCFTANILPAIVMTPLRPPTLGLDATEKFKVPFPIPTLPEVIVTQFTLLTACHAHRSSAKTFTEPVPPIAGRLVNKGEIE
jgi:hypothetical protein